MQMVKFIDRLWYFIIINKFKGNKKIYILRDFFFKSLIFDIILSLNSALTCNTEH